MSEILKIGAEFDVSQIVAGSAQAGAAFDHLSASAKQMATELQAAGNSTEEIYSQMTAAGISAATAATAVQSLGVVTQKTAAATEAAVVATRSYSEEAIRARVTTDVLTGNISRAENALIRFASHGSIIGPIMQAAFLPFAAIAFTEILSHMYESFQKLSDGVMGYTEEVKKAYEADAKFSTEALGHAQTLGEAQSKLTDILREEGQAAQSYGERFMEAAQRAEESTSSFISTIPILGSAVLLYESLAHAESDAADQAIRLGTAQRSLMSATVQQQIALDREALKLIGDRTAAENAGADSHIAQIRNEIAALADKQRVEEDIAVHEAGLKAMTQGGNAVQAERDAKAAVDQEYYYKQIALTKDLSTAEDEAARKNLERNNASIDAFRKAQADRIEAAQKAADQESKMAEEEAHMFAASKMKEVDAAIKAADEATKAEDKYREESMKISEQVSLSNIAAEEAKVSGGASLAKDKLAGSGAGELTRLNVTEAINQQELTDLEKLEDQKLAIQLKYLNDEKAILLAGRSPQEFATSASPEELTQALRINGQIEAAQQAHNSKMAEFNRQSVSDAQKTADAQTAAYMKAFSPINRAMDGMVNGILQGTLTIQQAFVRMGANIALTTIDTLAQMALKWAEHELAITVAHLVGTQTRVAATATAAGQTKAVDAATGLSEIGHAAAVGAAKAYSAMAGIPIIGPILGAAAAAATFATIIGFEALAGAEAGAEIPSNMPLFVHAGETVAPKPLSAAMHSLAPNIQKFNMAMNAPSAAAPAAAGPSSSSVSNISVQAFDASSFRDFAHRNQKQFVQAARGMIRNGAR